ncbi:doublecortin domain-containing protein 1 [Clupea harengus]|uniref:Doublecortin domain-containing protein 1 n=1 Tax=Clupea harengus TaxID=7950 RepID=A0A6P8ETA8_CLUHA|nr:doublecortin domain-containing protein 1 [Clupea harengus]
MGGRSRWAIRPERIPRKERGNLQRSQQGYAWPVLPTGEINEGVIWPLEGALVPCSLPFPFSDTRGRQSFTPLRLAVLRNGQCGDRTMATSVTLPNITSSRMRSQMAKSQGSCEGNTDDQNIEFQEFLNRCTERLNLPSAAQRLFDEHGKEAFLLTGLQRDQLVYVTCGEQWVSPQHRQSDALRRLTVFRLEQDVARIRHYCALRSLHDLVLDVEGHPQEGSALLVRPYCVEPEDITSEESQGPPDPKARCDLSNARLGDAHSRAHQRADEQTTKHQYPWQQSSKASSDEEDECTNGDNSVKKDKSRPGAHRQQFEWTEGQLVSCWSPWLAVGVRAREGGSADHTGSPMQLMPRNPSDPQQLWVCREGERTLHLQADPSLVLSVSISQTTHVHRPATTPTGWPLTLQKHKPHSSAVAHQRWRWLPEQRVLCAFYTDTLEQELTAARLASVCTACVCPHPLQQQGYYVCSPRERQRTEVCVSCATELRGKVHLKRLPLNSTFRCATANQNPQLNLRGPFRNLSVCETDLSTEAAGVTLRRLEERLGHLRREGSGQTQSPGASSLGGTQPPVKVLAHRNGQSREEAQLITAATMPLLLAEGTRRLGLQRAAKHLYAADGTRFLTIQQLKAWALNQSLREHHPLKDTDTKLDIHMTDATTSGGTVNRSSP